MSPERARGGLRVRPFEDGDEEALAGLAARVRGTSKDGTSAGLEALGVQDSAPHQAAVAWRGDHLVAACAVARRQAMLSGTEVVGVVETGRLLDPQRGTRAILERCVRHTLTLASDDGAEVAAVLRTLPSRDAAVTAPHRRAGMVPIFVRVLRLASLLDPAGLRALFGRHDAHLDAAFSAAGAADAAGFVPFSDHDEPLDGIWAELGRHYDCGLLRTPAELEARYARRSHGYLAGVVEGRGLVVARLVERNGLRVVALMDWLFDPLDEATGLALVERLVVLGDAAGAHAVVAASVPTQPAHHVLADAAFVPLGPRLMAHPLALEVSALHRRWDEPWLFDSRSWAVSLGDAYVA